MGEKFETDVTFDNERAVSLSNARRVKELVICSIHAAAREGPAAFSYGRTLL
jgi:hypothetical protein